MKKVIFFLFSMIALASCVDYSSPNEPVVVSTSDYSLKVNGVPVKNNDTVYVGINDIILFEMLDVAGNKVDGVFYSNNLNSSFGSGTIASIQYPGVGTYKVSASLVGGSKTLYVYITVAKSTSYTLQINGTSIVSGSTFKATTTQSLKFKVIDVDGKTVTTSFDFGNGSKVKTDSISVYYPDAGTYTFKSITGSKTMTVTMVVTKGATDAIVLISSNVSGGMINAVLGLRCNAIPNFSPTKTTYVAGETPNAVWNKYIVSDIVTINSVDYFKWSVSVPAGKFRMSWVQQKDPTVTFNYDQCNWSYDPTSAFWNTADYLYYFYLRIDTNNAVVLSAN